jgi:hypothetical protein
MTTNDDGMTGLRNSDRDNDRMTAIKTTARTMNITQHPHLCYKQLLAGWMGGCKDGDGNSKNDNNDRWG